MKIKNIFKSKKKIVEKATVQKLEKTQLQKVSGGISTLMSNGSTNQWPIK